MNPVQLVDLFHFKFNYTCLTSTKSGQFYLDINEDGSPLRDWDDSIIEDPFGDLPPFQYYETGRDSTGTNYYTNLSGADYSNYGWDSALEYDKYPLEIQCRSCFVGQFFMGIESQWGEVYEEELLCPRQDEC
ncbi:hypothetical protein BJX99DRAFT_259107 [Aspergillus californicus]